MSMELNENLLENEEKKKSYWNNLVKNVTHIASSVKEETQLLLNKLGSEKLQSTEFLFDPHATLQRSYGTLGENGYFINDLNEGGRLSSPDPNLNFGQTNPLSASAPQIRIFESSFDSSNSSPPSPHVENESLQQKAAVPPYKSAPVLQHLTVDLNTAKSSRRSSIGSHGRNSPLPSPGFSASYEFNNETVEPEVFTWARIFKIFLLILVFGLIAGAIISTSENHEAFKLITASKDTPYQFSLQLSDSFVTYYPVLTILIKGAFVPSFYQNYTTNRLSVKIERENRDGSRVLASRDDIWEVPIFSAHGIGIAPETTLSHGFDLNRINFDHESKYYIVFQTNTPFATPLSVSGRFLSGIAQIGAIFGGLVMIGLYILIIFELVNRTLAAMLAAAGSIAALSALNERPSTEEMVSWLDMETLILLFSMMLIVSILCETGFFDYASFFMYKKAGGRVWTLITALCFFTATVSAFLDNVTTILLMTPVTIRICEAMELNPVPILISIVVFSNIGGAVTPVGDPPNVIISNNKDVIGAGIDFTTFSLHMLIGIIPVILIAYLQLRLTFRNIKKLKFSEPYQVAELRREVETWQRAVDSLSSYSKDESQVKALLASKVLYLKNKLKSKLKMGGQSEESFQANLSELEASCKIRDWRLLIKCGCVLTIVIILFFLHSIPQLNLSMGWTALLGAVFLLILSDRREMEGILSRIEWSTLIFFSALFIVMEGISRLGLLEWIGNQTEDLILEVNEESRLTVSICLILWVSGIASAFIDNIPFTTMMIKIVTRLSERLHIPLQPLVWALAFGTCLGGNGTLIGASANVVGAGVAHQHGYKITFTQWFKIGFPMMTTSLVVSTFYLLLCHSWFHWH